MPLHFRTILLPPDSSLALASLCCALQASLLCVLEEKLYAPSHAELAGEVMYPAWLIVATSAAGLATCHWLRADAAISHAAAWVLVSLHGAKLCMLILPEAYLVLPSALLVLAVTVGAVGMRVECDVAPLLYSQGSGGLCLWSWEEM